MSVSDCWCHHRPQSACLSADRSLSVDGVTPAVYREGLLGSIFPRNPSGGFYDKSYTSRSHRQILAYALNGQTNGRETPRPHFSQPSSRRRYNPPLQVPSPPTWVWTCLWWVVLPRVLHTMESVVLILQCPSCRFVLIENLTRDRYECSNCGLHIDGSTLRRKQTNYAPVKVRTDRLERAARMVC
jgi:predicted RNA-binding Zn-ribbon protein involved in translation (DUF1610 family)